MPRSRIRAPLSFVQRNMGNATRVRKQTDVTLAYSGPGIGMSGTCYFKNFKFRGRYGYSFRDLPVLTPSTKPYFSTVSHSAPMSMNLTTSTARVYVDYDQSIPPPHPGTDWTRFVCISDTHSRVFPVPNGDILLHSGDLSSWGHPHQLEFTLAWLKSLPHSQKVCALGISQ